MGVNTGRRAGRRSHDDYEEDLDELREEAEGYTDLAESLGLTRGDIVVCIEDDGRILAWTYHGVNPHGEWHTGGGKVRWHCWGFSNDEEFHQFPDSQEVRDSILAIFRASDYEFRASKKSRR